HSINPCIADLLRDNRQMATERLHRVSDLRQPRRSDLRMRKPPRQVGIHTVNLSRLMWSAVIPADDDRDGQITPGNTTHLAIFVVVHHDEASTATVLPQKKQRHFGWTTPPIHANIEERN